MKTNKRQILKEDFKMKTDLQKYKEFFDEMNVEYMIRKHEKINAITLYIDKGYIYQGSANVIAIRFNGDESFIEFEAWNE